jgi:hypothetical protein
MNPLTRKILIIGTVAVLSALIGGFMLWVMPVQAQASKLTQELEAAKNDRKRVADFATQMVASTSVIRAQLDQLALYDLREEADPQNVLQTRSNSQLIQVSKILEDATISVREFNLVRSINVPIAESTTSPPIASVQKQHFQLNGAGLYKHVLYAFEQLQQLPPTVAINNYSVRYASKAGTQAVVEVTMDVSFNFLMKPVAGAPGAAGGGGSAFDQMMRQMGGKTGALPGQALRVARACLAWLDPPAHAATGQLVVSRSGVRVIADGHVGFRTFRLADGRIVVDMPGLTVTHKQVVRVGRGGVRTARLAQFSQHPLVGRLVLDTARAAVYPRRTASGVVVALPATRPQPRPLPAREEHQGGNLNPGPGPSPIPESYRQAREGVTRPQAAAAPEPLVRKVAVQPWRVGEIRRIAVQPVGAIPSQGVEPVLRRIDVRPGEPEYIVSPVLAPVLVSNPVMLAAAPAKAAAGATAGASGSKVPGLAPPAPGSGASGSPTTAGGTDSIPAGRRQSSLPEVEVGRDEPFFPLVDATASVLPIAASTDSILASGSATGSTESTAIATQPVVPVTPPPQRPVIPQPVIVQASPTPIPRLAITLRGVLVGANTATGLFDVDGRPVRASAGAMLGPGYIVRWISRDAAMISTPFGMQKTGLARTWVPTQARPLSVTEAAPMASSGPPMMQFQQQPQFQTQPQFQPQQVAPAPAPVNQAPAQTGGAPNAMLNVTQPTAQQVPAPPPTR